MAGKIVQLRQQAPEVRQTGPAAAPAVQSARPASMFDQLNKATRRGVLLSVVPFGALMAGLSLLPIPGAVIAGGYLTSESAPKLVQSSELGVIDAILVRDGDHVNAGDEVIRLDDTQARAELTIVTKTLDQLAARNARLDAEAMALDAVTFPQDLVDRDNEPEVAAILEAERGLFDLRRQAFLTQVSQMEEQATQIDEQVKGIDGQIASIDRQHQILEEELSGLRELLQGQLVSASRVSEAEQNLSIVQGQQAELNATLALARARLAELGSQLAELNAQRMSDAAEEQREVQAQLGELGEKQIAARRRLEQMVLVAPVDGTVTDLRVRTEGGIANASETLLTIIPGDDRLLAELKVSPRDISRVRLNQEAELHFTSIGGSSAPQFKGKVTFVAPDIVTDERTGLGHFVVRVEMGEPINDAARNLEDLGSGTPVEVFLLTDARTVIEYITKPIVDQAQRAFR